MFGPEDKSAVSAPAHPAPELGPKSAAKPFSAIPAQITVVYSTTITVVTEIAFRLMTVTMTGFMAAAFAITAAAATTAALFLKILVHAYPPLVNREYSRRGYALPFVLYYIICNRQQRVT